MHFRHLRLSCFRNYEALDVDFSADVNCITGKNGSGKTNILDALHFLALTRGFRSSIDKQAIQEESNFFFIEGELLREDLEIKLQCNLMTGKTKKLLKNGVPVSRMSDHIGFVPLVAVLPEDTELIHGGSSVRRKFMDALICQYDRPYMEALMRYEKIIEQRNALLRHFGDSHTWDATQLELWNMQMIPAGMEITRKRRAFLQEFEPAFMETFHHIVSQSETPKIVLQSHIKENSEAEWLQLLQQAEMKDRVNQTTASGVHRDDLEFSINGASTRHYGSQGQQKTFVIALKLAQYEMLKAAMGVPPILLLDDIFDKLDAFRLQEIAQLLDKQLSGQVFITDTSKERLAEVFADSQRKIKFIEVKKGALC